MKYLYQNIIKNDIQKEFNNLLATIFNDLNNSKNITSQISTDVPRFILYLKERYGNDKGYNILKKDHIVFIAVKRKGTYDLYDIVTKQIRTYI